MASRPRRREAVFTVGAVLAAFAFACVLKDDITRRRRRVRLWEGAGFFGGLPRNGVKGGKRLFCFPGFARFRQTHRCFCRGNVGDASLTGVFQAQRHSHGRGVTGCPRWDGESLRQGRLLSPALAQSWGRAQRLPRLSSADCVQGLMKDPIVEHRELLEEFFLEAFPKP